MEDADLQTFHRLRRLSMTLEMSRQDFAHRYGLHPTDLRALVCLLDAQRSGAVATPGWLGAELGLNSAGTTTLLDRLEHLGHVRRRRDEVDRRRVLITVTAKAKRLGWQFFGPQMDAAATAMQQFSAPERDVVDRFLDAVVTAL